MQDKTINGFTLQRLLGTGGMAEVWYAENNIGMKAAVKIISEKLSHDDQMQERFLNEAKVMVMLDHPNIRKVYGFDQIDGRPAIIMEYLDGADLKAKMKRGQRFTQEELVKWWNQLVDALNYTHAQDIVHRDIKPSNIFIDQRGNAKLLDFGIAKVADTTSGTQTGSTLGTRIYMSPEQVRDPKRVGTASDVYSLAVSFVHLLTGKAPYDSTTTSDYDIQVSIVTKPVDMSKVPDEWRDFLTPYLNKEPNQRPALRPFEAVRPEKKAAENTDEDDSTMVEGAKQPEVKVVQQPKQKIVKEQVQEPKDKPKSKKGLWIGLCAAAIAVIAFAILAWPKSSVDGSFNGHDYVDLGLPSGTLWATCNVGANKPKDYGDYYAWGETKMKESYDFDTYKYANGMYGDMLTKYCNKSSYGNNGFTDNLTELQACDDPATANWGSGWHTPSRTQWDELLQHTTNKWTTQNGVAGLLFTSKKNGKLLFLPAAGSRWDSELIAALAGCLYWSRTLDTDNPDKAWFFYFNSGGYGMYSDGRSYGSLVRPVREK